MELLASLLFLIGVVVLLAILLGVLGLASVELRWIVHIWTRDPNDPWP
jgi:hypothetical protein